MLQNLFLYRNDTDFDRTAPAYNANGQSEGALATVFRPQLTFHITPHLRLYYEVEIGLAFWGENDPNEQSPSVPDYFILRNRELYTEGDVLGGKVGFKVGYQYFHYLTALFLGTRDRRGADLVRVAPRRSRRPVHRRGPRPDRGAG